MTGVSEHATMVRMTSFPAGRRSRFAGLLAAGAISASIMSPPAPAGASAATGAAAPAKAKAASLPDVSANTAAATTMSFALDADMGFTVAGKKLSGKMTASGVTDRAKQATSITMDMGSFMTSIMAASGQQLPPQLRDPSLFTLKMVSIGPKVWMSFPFMNQLGGNSAKPWTLLDAKALGVDANELAASQGLDPMQGLDMLKGLDAGATAVGTELVDGVATTRYRGAVKLETLVAKSPQKSAAQVRSMFGGQSSIPVEVWVDDQGRARRVDMTIKGSSQGVDMTMKLRTRYSKFGEKVAVNPPPAAQVATANENPIFAEAIKQQVAQRKAAK